MAFYPWIETRTETNCQDASTFGGDSQRVNGFTAGTVASSIRVNTALRQANLIACALMSAIGDSTHSVESTVGDIAQSIRDHVALDIPYYLLNQNFSIYTPLEMDSVNSRGCFSICNNANAKNKIRNGHLNCYFFGEGLESYGSDQFLIGTYNGTASSTDILIVGSGSPIDRQNALRLNFDGGLWIGGNLTVGGNHDPEFLRPDLIKFVKALSNKSHSQSTIPVTLTKGLYSFTITVVIEAGVIDNYNLLFDTGDEVSYSTRFKIRGIVGEFCLKSTPSENSQDECTISLVNADSLVEEPYASKITYKLVGWNADFNLT